MATISEKTSKYLGYLEEKYNYLNFAEFISDLLNLYSDDIVNGAEKPVEIAQYKDYIDSSRLYAKYKDEKNRYIGVNIIKLKDTKNPANARTMQRNYIANLMDTYNLDASISVVYSDNDDSWRLSFVKQDISFADGKITQMVTPVKRYSYLVGKNEPNHTAKNQLMPLLENDERQYTIEEIEERFSVEKVTKDFFENYKENYLKLKETLEANEEFISEAARCDFTSEEFTKKLMGQIVFIYFLQKKRWLGVRLVPQVLSCNEYNNIYNKCDIIQKKILDKYYINFNGSKKVKKDLLEKYNENKQEIESLSDIFSNTEYDKKWGTGQEKFIRTIFDNCINRNKNFFDDYLEPFFYDGLNHKRKNQYFSLFNCKIPFLNGGLFEPLENYNWEITRFNIDNEIFSNKEESGILDFFERYNFTINEEEPLEKDVAVDPEMLGKIFENLLDVKDRKSKGAFYTPREIVHYMCQESIANFLVNKVGVEYDEIKELIQYGELIRDTDLREATQNSHMIGDSVFNNIVKIDKALEKIKIADPAVGSGAFPLGMLNEIVKIRDILTSYMLIYNRLGLFGQVYSEKQITNNKRSIYNLKWNTIKNSIYAVDIENSAVDITKLRLWLSIVVDQTGDPEPLPNLNCKIMQGNSLIDEYVGIKLIDEKFIEELKDRDNVKFNNSNGVTRDLKGRKQYVSDNQIEFGDGQKKAQIDDLIKLKQELYEENEPNRKKSLLEKIQLVRNEILSLNFRGTNKEKELLEIDCSHNKPYFAWMLEFIEVFIENDGFDIVIGNPPYVSNKGTDDVAKSNLEKIYGFSDDLYYHFIIKGYDLINNNGTICMITPDTYYTINTKINLRKKLLENRIIKLIDLGYDIFPSAMVSTAIVIVDKKYDINWCLEFNDVRHKESIAMGDKYIIKQSLYNESINNAFFVPSKINIKINEKLGKKQNLLINNYWNYIKTSKDILKNKNILDEYRNSLKPNDITIAGTITDGGQGLATANNGRFLGIREGTREANRVKPTRKIKLEEFNKAYKQCYVLPNNEIEVWNLFETIKDKYGRDVFGQGYVYKIVPKELLADLKILTNDEKLNGINEPKCFVPYEKGDKEGNRWYFDNPFVIQWSKENVKYLKDNAGKKGKGGTRYQNPQFYFKEGFCYMDVNTYYLKARKKPVSIHDVMGMSFFPLLESIPAEYFICIINSEFIAGLVFNFLNNTSHFQINDFRMLPIPVPTLEEKNIAVSLYNEAEAIQKKYFKNEISKEERDSMLKFVQEKVDKFVLRIYKMEE